MERSIIGNPREYVSDSRSNSSIAELIDFPGGSFLENNVIASRKDHIVMNKIYLTYNDVKRGFQMLHEV